MSQNVPGLCLSTRLNLAFVCFLGCIIVYAVRSNVSFAIVCMVNSTALEQTNDGITADSKKQQCIRASKGNDSVEIDKIEGSFAWDKSVQGNILGAFFYGYMSSQILSGYLASKYGGKLVIGFTGIGGAILTLISPLAANTSVYAFIFVRALLGFFQASTFPAMHAMWSLWAPPLERSVLTGISYAGAQIGNVLVMPMSGLLCKYGPFGGWPSIFYFLGIFALLWCGLWFYYVSDNPQNHPKISEDEKKYITESLGDSSGGSDSERPPVPWKKILTSLPIWAIFVGHFAGDWGAYMMATSLPLFMNDVLGFDLTSMGFLTSIPYIFYFICINVGGILADTLQNKKILSTVNTRRLAMLVALGSQALFLVLIGYCTCGQEALVILLITLSIGLSGLQYAGFVVNYLDVAPTFAGPILGIGNTISCVAGILAPKFMGLLTPNGTKEEWQTVFYLTGAILIFGAVFFSIFAKGELQPWANTSRPPIEMTERLLISPEISNEINEVLKKPKHYNIDLDLPPEERWNQVIDDHLDAIPLVLEEAKSYVPTPLQKPLFWIAEKLTSLFPEDYVREMRGIANRSGLAFGEIVGLNILYDITSFNRHIFSPFACTSIVAEDTKGRILHGRNLDYDMGTLLRNITIIADFTKKGKVEFTATTFALYVGILTGQKPQAYAISLNARYAGGYIDNIIMEIITFFKNPVSFDIRKTLETKENYTDAITHLSRVHFVAPSYLIVSGTKAGQGVVITRNRWKATDIFELNAVKGRWFLVETNFDHWKEPEDDRRKAAVKYLMELKRNNLNENTLFTVISKPSINNKPEGTQIDFKMGSESSKHVHESKVKEPSNEKGKNRRQSAPDRRQSVNTGKITQPPTIRVGTSISCNDGFLGAEDEKKLQVDRPEWRRNRSGSASSDRGSSIKLKHPVPVRSRQLIQSCFQNPHEVLGKKILKRAAELRPDFAKFYVALVQDQREEVEESIKLLLKKTVCNIDFLDEIKRMAEEFGEKFVPFRSIGFKVDFFATVADATTKECCFLDSAQHPAHQTLSAFSQFVTMVFSSVRDGYYNEMRRLRRTSNSFSTGSNNSTRRKKPSIDSFSATELMLPSRSVSPSSESRLSDECFTSTIHECEEGFLKPPTMVSARIG